MKQIPPDIYGYELNNFFWKCKTEIKEDEEQLKHLGLLRRILSCRLTSVNDHMMLIKDFKIDEEQIAIIRQEEWDKSDNIQVRNRCNDVLRKTVKGDKRNHIKSLCHGYYEEYKKTDNVECIIRALELLAYIHYKDEHTLELLCPIIETVHWRWIESLLNIIKKMYEIDELKSIINILNCRRKKEHSAGEYDKERGFIRCLNVLGEISTENRHRELAICYKLEVEKIEKNGRTCKNVWN